MHIDTPVLFDEIPSDDDFTAGLEEMYEVIRTTTDPLALATLAELLEHPHPSIRSAAAEALDRMHPKELDLRRQLSPGAAIRVRKAMGWTRTRSTRKARKSLVEPRGHGGGDEEDEE